MTWRNSEKREDETRNETIVHPVPRVTLTPQVYTGSRSVRFQLRRIASAVGALMVVISLTSCSPPNPSSEIVEVPDVKAVQANAESGAAEAQYQLGKLYAKGRGVDEDYKQAAKWYRLAADQGYAPAQVALGELYEAGQGVPHDDAAAAKLYRQAAEQGNAAAQYNLAAMNLMGQGVPQNLAEALKWYRQAAEQGYKLAQFNLGMRYYEGKGVTPDPVEAYQWLSLAAANGVPDAGPILDNLKSRMTSEQINEGRRRVAAFVPKKLTPIAK